MTSIVNVTASLLDGLGVEVKADLRSRSRPSSACSSRAASPSKVQRVGALLSEIGGEVKADLRSRSRPSSACSSRAASPSKASTSEVHALLDEMGVEVKADLRSRSRPSSAVRSRPAAESPGIRPRPSSAHFSSGTSRGALLGQVGDAVKADLHSRSRPSSAVRARPSPARTRGRPGAASELEMKENMYQQLAAVKSQLEDEVTAIKTEAETKSCELQHRSAELEAACKECEEYRRRATEKQATLAHCAVELEALRRAHLASESKQTDELEAVKNELAAELHLLRGVADEKDTALQQQAATLEAAQLDAVKSREVAESKQQTLQKCVAEMDALHAGIAEAERKVEEGAGKDALLAEKDKTLQQLEEVRVKLEGEVYWQDACWQELESARNAVAEKDALLAKCAEQLDALRKEKEAAEQSCTELRGTQGTQPHDSKLSEELAATNQHLEKTMVEGKERIAELEERSALIETKNKQLEADAAEAKKQVKVNSQQLEEAKEEEALGQLMLAVETQRLGDSSRIWQAETSQQFAAEAEAMVKRREAELQALSEAKYSTLEMKMALEVQKVEEVGRMQLMTAQKEYEVTMQQARMEVEQSQQQLEVAHDDVQSAEARALAYNQQLLMAKASQEQAEMDVVQLTQRLAAALKVSDDKDAALELLQVDSARLALEVSRAAELQAQMGVARAERDAIMLERDEVISERDESIAQKESTLAKYVELSNEVESLRELAKNLVEAAHERSCSLEAIQADKEELSSSSTVTRALLETTMQELRGQHDTQNSNYINLGLDNNNQPGKPLFMQDIVPFTPSPLPTKTCGRPSTAPIQRQRLRLEDTLNQKPADQTEIKALAEQIRKQRTLVSKLRSEVTTLRGEQGDAGMLMSPQASELRSELQRTAHLSCQIDNTAKNMAKFQQQVTMAATNEVESLLNQANSCTKALAESAEQVFRNIDYKKCGYADVTDLHSRLSEEGLSEAHIHRIFLNLDSDDNGRITMANFVQGFTCSTT